MTKVKPIKNKSEAKVKKAVNEDVVLEEYKRLSKKRFQVASIIYNDQDSLTKEVIDRIKDRLTIATTGVININGYPTKLDAETIERNVFFLSVEICNDLYMNGVRLANFKPSNQYCISCKKEILGVKKRG